MTKKIGNKTYSTHTATMVGSDRYLSAEKPEYWKEDIYISNDHEFFIYCEGGAMSKYNVQTADNEWSSNKDIIPLSRDEALAWLHRHNIRAWDRF